jgi:hypothetical protein
MAAIDSSWRLDAEGGVSEDDDDVAGDVVAGLLLLLLALPELGEDVVTPFAWRERLETSSMSRSMFALCLRA